MLAMNKMNLDKAPNPDGLNPRFYKFFWNLVGSEVSMIFRHGWRDRKYQSQFRKRILYCCPRK
ncbi:hypothetical protein LINPERHAP1_LOCUS4862 [Linum perenne]